MNSKADSNSTKPRAPAWLAIRADPPAKRSLVLKIFSFLIPLAIWCMISYVPFIWHPLVRITDQGGSDFLQPDMLIDRTEFDKENDRLREEKLTIAAGSPANPIFLPAPHEVGRALYTAFKTPPQRKGDPWFHESLWHSMQIIFWGFSLSCIIGVPLGIISGTFPTLARLTEPFVDFVRYMPAPVFGALCIAVLGLADAPKIAIIFIGTFFHMVLIIANTTRLLDPALLEAAQTLGANRKRLISRVIVPGILPNLYNDLRILLGSAWTLLIIAELIGATSGISYFINQQGKYRNYENVFAGIIIIGLIGLITDQFLARMRPVLFPWLRKGAGSSGGFFYWISGGRYTRRPLPLFDQRSSSELDGAAAHDVGVVPGGDQ